MSCPICKGPSVFSKNRKEWDICPSCVEGRVREGISDISERLSFVGVPSRYLNARLQDFKNHRFKNKRKGYLVIGPAGTGKTHLLAALAFECVSLGKPSLFYSASSLLFALREDLVRGNTLLSRVCAIPHLFLDDLGTEKQTEWVYETWFRLVDYRYSHSMHLSVTMNSISNIDERLFRRISEMTTLVEF